MYRSWARNCRWKAYRNLSTPNGWRPRRRRSPQANREDCAAARHALPCGLRVTSLDRGGWLWAMHRSCAFTKTASARRYYTAQRAMTTAVERGSRGLPLRRPTPLFAAALRAITTMARCFSASGRLPLRTPELLRAWIYAIRQESALPPEQRIHQRILWGMFTGEETYRTLFWLAVSPKASIEVLNGWGKLK